MPPSSRSPLFANALSQRHPPERHGRGSDADSSRPLKTVHRAFALLGLVLAAMSAYVFVGGEDVWQLLPMAGLALAAGVVFVESSRPPHPIRAARTLVPIVLAAVVLTFVLSQHASGVPVSPLLAGWISVPFCVFLAVVARSQSETLLLIVVAALSYLAGAWMSVQGDEYFALFVAGVVVATAMIGLGHVREIFTVSVARTVNVRPKGAKLRHERARRRAIAGAGSAQPPRAPVGRVPAVAATMLLLVAGGTVLCVAALVFVYLPRPEPNPNVRPGAIAGSQLVHDTESSLRRFAPQATSRQARPTGLDRRLSLVGDLSLYSDERPYFRVRFEGDRGDGPYRGHVFYLRVATYDMYDGVVWQDVNAYNPNGWQSVANEEGVRFPLGRAMDTGVGGPPHAATYRRLLDVDRNGTVPARHLVRVHITPLGGSAGMLPLPDLSLRTDATELDFHLASHTIRPARGQQAPRSYSVEALDVEPRRAWIGPTAQSESFSVTRTQLPAGRSPYYAEVAQQLIEQADAEGRPPTDAWEHVELVLAHLRHSGQFSYALDVAPPPAGMSPVEHFLSESHAGHCALFASAAAVLLREMDIPARVVVGFLSGDFNGRSNTYLVRGRHAHAWIEVRFDGYGWFPFEATPAVAGAPRPLRLQPDEADDADNPRFEFDNELLTDERVVTSGGSATPQPDAADDEATTGEDQDAEAAAADGHDRRGDANLLAAFSHEQRSRLWRALAALPIAIVGAGGDAVWPILGAMLLAAVLVITWMRSKARHPSAASARPLYSRRRAAEPRDEDWLAWYERSISLLARLGPPRAPWHTPAEYARALAATVGAAGPTAHAFEHLTRRYYRLRFGPGNISPAERAAMDDARADFERLLKQRDRAKR